MLRSCWDHYCHRWQHCDKYVFFAFLKVFIDLQRNKKNTCISFEYSKLAIFIMSIFNVTSSDTNILDCMFLMFHINESQIIKRSVKRWFFCLFVFLNRDTYSSVLTWTLITHHKLWITFTNLRVRQVKIFKGATSKPVKCLPAWLFVSLQEELYQLRKSWKLILK